VSQFFPFIFVLLWSSAFITTLPIVLNSDPFSALAFRFFFVAVCFFIYSNIKNIKIKVNFRNIFNSFSTGILFHGFYLGGVFYAIFVGLPTSIVALIVTLQPVLTNILAGYFLNEEVNIYQWIGIILGFAGAVMVIGFDIGSMLPMKGLVAAVIALIAITTSTIWQKKISNDLPLPVNNMYQAIGAVIFHLTIIILIFEDAFIMINLEFLLAMSHQVFLVSLGAFSILMYLIKNNSASKTVSLFFLIPAVTATMAWVFLDENLSLVDIIGFIVTSIGVFISTRKQKSQ
jgi:drug/metabolite transporter (DMT)-like permease